MIVTVLLRLLLFYLLWQALRRAYYVYKQFQAQKSSAKNGQNYRPRAHDPVTFEAEFRVLKDD